MPCWDGDTTRLAILSDIHANLPALDVVLADIGRLACDRIYHAGDLIGIGPYPAEVVDLARDTGLRCVQGNHDQLLTTGIPLAPTPNMDDGELMHQHWTHSRLHLAHRDFIRAFPYLRRETIDGVDLTVVHFALTAAGNSFKRVSPGGSDEEILRSFDETPGTLVCFGHLHSRQFNRQFAGRHFLSAGGVGCSHDSTAAYAVLDLHGGAFEVELRKVKYERGALLKRYDELEVPARESIRKAFFGVTGTA